MTSSQRLATRYRLQLDTTWAQWFDRDIERIAPIGALGKCVPVGGLVDEAPSGIWAGFMLPDTLPIVGNEYGDWICVRVGADNRFGELIYWYHGGGDWIPVGSTLAEAFLHDAIDQFRENLHQAIRGADESRVGLTLPNPRRLVEGDLFHWMTDHLPPGQSDQQDAVRTIARSLVEQDHRSAVQQLWQQQWAPYAAACDLLEHYLRTPLARIARPDIAESCGLNWYPDFVQLTFDVATIPAALRDRIRELLGDPSVAWPAQDWRRACHLADQVLAQRSDLGWAFTVAGWSRERAGETEEAAQLYFQGRLASSFSDQAVRFGAHSTAERLGKFSMARLADLQDFLSAEQRADGYASLFFNRSNRSLLAVVSQWWMERAQEALANGAPETAYECYYRAGWDLGVSRLVEYQPILEGLVTAAKQAGWEARAEVARTHLQRLHRQIR